MITKNDDVLVDVETWNEFLTLRDRMVETLGMICPLIEIALQPDYPDKRNFLRAAVVLAASGQTLLKKFLVLLEETRKHGGAGKERELPKEVVDILESVLIAAKRNSSSMAT